MRVYEPGTQVTVGNGIQASVIESLIKMNHHIVYRVVWFDGHLRRDEWVEEFEVSPAQDTTTLKIGFKA